MWKVEGVLSAEQEAAGLELWEDEDFVYLKREDKVLLSFLLRATTPQFLQQAANAYLRADSD